MMMFSPSDAAHMMMPLITLQITMPSFHAFCRHDADACLRRHAAALIRHNTTPRDDVDDAPPPAACCHAAMFLPLLTFFNDADDFAAAICRHATPPLPCYAMRHECHALLMRHATRRVTRRCR